MKIKIFFSSLFFILHFLFAEISLCQNNQLDPTFGIGGVVNTPFNLPGSSPSYSSAIQSDGKLVYSGYYYLSGSYGRIWIMRYNPDGSPDNSFGIDGLVKTSIDQSHAVLYSLAIQSDGKIITAGDVFENSSSKILLVRYNADGSLDNTFGNNGIVTTSITSTSNDVARSILLQNDGKIVAVGINADYSDTKIAVVRYNTNGLPDNSFGTNGIVTAQYMGLFSEATSATIQSDGKIIAAGAVKISSSNKFGLARFNTNGSLDNTFGTNGFVIASIGDADLANSVKLQDDGKILAAGVSTSSNNQNFCLMRFSQNGNLDNTFGTNGIVTTTVTDTSQDYCTSMAIQSDGKIISSGFTKNGTFDDFALIRYNMDGNLDGSFGNNGIVVTQLGIFNDVSTSLLLQNNGKIIASGFISDSVYSTSFVSVRYNQEGSIDNSFGSNGKIITAVRVTSAFATSEAIQPNGKIVVSGYAFNGTNNDFGLVRYNSNGSLDNTFGNNGIILIPIGASNDYAYAVTVQNDGKIIEAGYSINPNNYNNIVLVRYNTNGSLDNSFGTQGIMTTSLSSNSNCQARSVIIQNDGKIVVAGYTDYNIYDDFILVRYNSNGSLDNTFGTNGIVTASVSSNSIDDAYALAIQNDGKLIVSGISYYSSYFDFCLMRFNQNGSLDNTFGANGIVTTRLGTSDAFVYSLQLQSDEKILAGGTTYDGSKYQFTIVRYNQDGSLDNNFGTAGIVITPIGNVDDEINALTIQNDGKIIAAGYSDTGNKMNIVLCRYNTSGNLDDTFGTNGIIITSNGISSSTLKSVLLQSDGKIVTGGYSDIGSDENEFTVLRFYPEATSGIDDNKEIAKSFYLQQNFPNPFNPSTTIRYQLPTGGELKLEVYDILGNKIATLINEYKPAGDYEVEYHAINIPSGVYFYELKADEFVQTKKMLLIK